MVHSSYKHSKCFPDIYNMCTQKQTPFTVTHPRPDEAQDWRGLCNPGACAEFHILIRNTSPDRDVSYLEFVFSGYE